MTEKPMIDQSFEVVAEGFEAWLETLSPQEIEDLNALLDSVEEEEIVEPKVVEPKAGKVKCKCCGFAKKARRVNAEGICKVCYVALATASPDEPVVVVGRQGKRGRNTVSVMIGGERVKVQRKVRLES